MGVVQHGETSAMFAARVSVITSIENTERTPEEALACIICVLVPHYDAFTLESD